VTGSAHVEAVGTMSRPQQQRSSAGDRSEVGIVIVALESSPC
jgi:hypothetical protein